MNQSAPNLPELLAPAGSLESFHAAIEAGANAIYLGIDEFNARLRAKNFSIKTLAYLLPYAHKKGIKVYITLNTLIKQVELKELIHLLYQLEQLQVDALIAQDLGLVYIVREYFPNLVIHASTQMVIHNSPGANAALDQGIKRVILSRELTLTEIHAISKRSRIELEVFIHGALCYSVSGLCLASSYLGGWSGNRGRCTQVCRRKFTSETGGGFFFSPKDFWALEFIDEFKKIGVASLKIEGRMKSGEYVYQVVSAYRDALDHSTGNKGVAEQLKNDFGREKTSFFLATQSPQNIIVAKRPSGTGIVLGSIVKAAKETIEIKTNRVLNPGDKIRVHNQDGDEGERVPVKSSTQKGGLASITVNRPTGAQAGDLVYLISKKNTDRTIWRKKKLDESSIKMVGKHPSPGKLLKRLNRSTDNPSAKKSYIRIDNTEWLNLLKSITFDKLIINGNLEVFEQLLNALKQIRFWREKLILELPPFIPEDKLPSYQSLIEELISHGLNSWMCGHFGQKELLPKEVNYHAGNSVWTTNRATQQFLTNNNFATFQYSLEDDILSLKALASPNGIMPLFAYVPLFISRIRPPLKSGRLLIDNKSSEFRYIEKGKLHYLLAEKPLCLLHRQEKLRSIGIDSFLLDLSFTNPSRKWLKTIISHYQKQEKLHDTSLFNHKDGLK